MDRWLPCQGYCEMAGSAKETLIKWAFYKR